MNTLLYHFTSRNRTKLKYVISKIFPRDFNHSIFISHHRLKSLDIINGSLWPASDWWEGPTPTWNGIEEVACEFVSEENKFWNIDIFNGRPRGWWRELVLNLWSGPGGLQKDFISLLVVSNCASSSVFWSMRRLFLLLFDNNFGKYHGKGDISDWPWEPLRFDPNVEFMSKNLIINFGCLIETHQFISMYI